jgi:hypothetical protein
MAVARLLHATAHHFMRRHIKGKARALSSSAGMRAMSRKRSDRKWSARVTQESHALMLEEGVFTWHDPKRIARSLKRSAEMSTERKAEPYRSALSMLTFYINRAGTNLPEAQRKVLERAKIELKKQFGRA